MSSDNYNMIIQLPDGKWILSANHNMTQLMLQEEKDAYNRAIEYAERDITRNPEYDSQEAAFEAADKEYAEHGTFSYHWRPEYND